MGLVELLREHWRSFWGWHPLGTRGAGEGVRVVTRPPTALLHCVQEVEEVTWRLPGPRRRGLHLEHSSTSIIGRVGGEGVGGVKGGSCEFNFSHSEGLV